MFDMSQAIDLRLVFSSVALLLGVIAVCVYAVNQKTKQLKDKK